MQQIRPERDQIWTSTMAGFQKTLDSKGHKFIQTAHSDTWVRIEPCEIIGRKARDLGTPTTSNPAATQSSDAGNRLILENPDPLRTCFERDRDRILHSTAFRRLAGKTQVFIFPEDHQRTRLTHALEVAQVARAIASSLGLNCTLSEAIALGHDCGHGPGGHASEDALSPYIPGGYEHAKWGADITLSELNLCSETLDGIRNHSWSRPAPSTPEGEVVSWADRIAYVCHDFEDAKHLEIVHSEILPQEVQQLCGHQRREQLSTFIEAVIHTSAQTGIIGMDPEIANALALFRSFNYEYIYLREESLRQSAQVVDLLRGLTEHYLTHPADLPEDLYGGNSNVESVVAYVAGMTDRFACLKAQQLLGWEANRLPTGIGNGI